MPEPGDIESEIDRLYGLPLDEFVKARDELAAGLRKAGRRDDAATVKGQRKPTVGAWALNQAARTRRDDLRELLEAGEALRGAQERLLAGGERGVLREASERERELVARLAGAAAVIGGEAGRSAALEPRLQATLHAAALDEGVREELAAGRLVREHEPVTLGSLSLGEPERATKPASAGRKTREPSQTARGRGRARAADPDAQRAEELAELEARVREARERAEAASDAVADADEEAAEARERAEAATAERKEAERAERAARKAVRDAERAQRAARKAVQEADGARRAARKEAQEADRAAQRLAREAEKLLAGDAKPRRRRG